MTRYAITDRKIVSADEVDSRRLIVEMAARWTAQGVSYIQLREKDLPAGELSLLVRQMKSALAGSQTKLLVNSRLDVAIACGADGIHLTSREGELRPADVRRAMPSAVISISSHSIDEVKRAAEEDADVILFGPVFGKSVGGEIVVPGLGPDLLRQACEVAGQTPVLALGGVTPSNVDQCLQAGAAGIAAIRMFL